MRTTLLLVLGLAMTGPRVSGGEGPVPVSTKPAKAGVDILLFTAMDAGKVLGTTDQDGRTSIDPLSAAMDLGKLDVVDEKCGDGKERILLVDPSLTDGMLAKKDGCRRRKLGVFWWGKDPRLDVKLGGGPNLVLLGLGGLGGVGAIVATTGGGGGSGSPTSPGSPSTGTPPNPGGNVTTFCGNFTGQLTVMQVGCSFNTQFASVVELTCSADGSARLVIRRADNDPQGQRFEYSGRVSANGALEFTGSGNLRGLATYDGRFTGNVSADGRTLSGTNTVTFTETSCRGQVLVQSVSGSR